MLRAALLAAVAAGCGGSPETAPGAAGSHLAGADPVVAISPEQPRFAPGEQRRLTASVTDAQGTSRPASSVRWSSSRPAVLEVDVQGLATARALGVATITAEVPEGSATLTAVVCEAWADECVPGAPGPPPEGPVRVPPGPPPPDPRRPPEIVDVTPAEDQVLDPYDPVVCRPGEYCPARPDFVLQSIQVATRFPGDDEPAAARMWVDGAAVPVAVRTETPVPGMFIDGYVDHWLRDHPLDAGQHEVTVEVTSREDRAARYTWRFTFTEPTWRP
jgi:hypothetical protein